MSAHRRETGRLVPGRSDVVAIARQWIGTPYHHQASLKGVGTDCLGIVRGVYRELFGFDPEAPPAYSADWAEALGRETLLEAAARHLVVAAASDVRDGDVLVFRIRSEARAKHMAILTSATTMVHAVEASGTVEVPLGDWWRRRIAGVYAFPEKRELSLEG
jgi:NlpC/P60 family putative phage cell wall peptidase